MQKPLFCLFIALAGGLLASGLLAAACAGGAARPMSAPWAVDNMTGDGASRLFAPGAKLEKLAGGFGFTEGPAADREGNLYFTDQPNDRIMLRRPDGALSEFLKPAGRSNGMCLDAAGDLIACADEFNQLWSIGRDGKVTVLVKDYRGRLLNGPNDVWAHPSGGFYITDPFYPRSYWKRGPQEQDCEGVYFLKPDRRTLVLAASDLVKPNGIVGTPDGKTLYVSDIRAAKTYAYDAAADGSLAGKRLVCNLGSDGMTLDSEGNLYLTGRGVTVVSQEGRTIASIAVPEPWTSNVAFGGKDRKTLFITASAGLYATQMSVSGIE